MSEFNFKSAICTDKNQSERLLALGLKKETADMYLCPSVDGTIYQVVQLPESSFAEDEIPAWSLHRLLMMTTSKRKVMLIRCESDIYDVVIKRIEHEIKEGYFNKEYLNGTTED